MISSPLSDGIPWEERGIGVRIILFKRLMKLYIQAAGREQSDSDDGMTIDRCTLSHWSGTAAAVDGFSDVEIEEEETWSNRQTLDYRHWNSRPFEN